MRNMKIIAPIVAGLASTSVAWSLFKHDQAVLDTGAAEDRYLIELAPGETRWIKEDEKWALRRVCSPSCRSSTETVAHGVLTL